MIENVDMPIEYQLTEDAIALLSQRRGDRLFEADLMVSDVQTTTHGSAVVRLDRLRHAEDDFRTDVES